MNNFLHNPVTSYIETERKYLQKEGKYNVLKWDSNVAGLQSHFLDIKSRTTKKIPTCEDLDYYQVSFKLKLTPIIRW